MYIYLYLYEISNSILSYICETIRKEKKKTLHKWLCILFRGLRRWEKHSLEFNLERFPIENLWQDEGQSAPFHLWWKQEANSLSCSHSSCWVATVFFIAAKQQFSHQETNANFKVFLLHNVAILALLSDTAVHHSTAYKSHYRVTRLYCLVGVFSVHHNNLVHSGAEEWRRKFKNSVQYQTFL